MYLALWLSGGVIWVIASLVMVGRVGISRRRTAIALAATLAAAFFGARLHAVLGEIGIPGRRSERPRQPAASIRASL
jgi:hypothetical protein